MQRPDVARGRPQDPVAFHLLDRVCHPADRPADREGGREERGRQPDLVQHDAGVELHVRPQPALGILLLEDLERDAFDLDGYRRLGDLGVTELQAVPWYFNGGDPESLDNRVDSLTWFADEVIAKFDA